MQKKHEVSVIKNGIKNYFVNLKYFFTPLGSLFLGIALGLSVAVPGILSVLQTLAEKVVEIAQDTGVTASGLWAEILTELENLPWNDPVRLSQTLFATDWLYVTLYGALQKLTTDFGRFGELLTEAVKKAAADISAYFTVFVFCAMLGLAAGYLLTKYLVRRNIAKRKIWRFIVTSIFESTVAAAMISLCAYLTSLWQPGIIISTVLTVILFGFISLLEACASHAKKREDWKRVLTIKNIIMLTVSNVLIYLIAFILSAIASALINLFVGLCIALPLFIIALLVTNMNAESFVKKTSEQAMSEEPDIKLTEERALPAPDDAEIPCANGEAAFAETDGGEEPQSSEEQTDSTN